jgi:hypothetical protein
VWLPAATITIDSFVQKYATYCRYDMLNCRNG